MLMMFVFVRKITYININYSFSGVPSFNPKAILGSACGNGLRTSEFGNFPWDFNTSSSFKPNRGFRQLWVYCLWPMESLASCQVVWGCGIAILSGSYQVLVKQVNIYSVDIHRSFLSNPISCCSTVRSLLPVHAIRDRGERRGQIRGGGFGAGPEKSDFADFFVHQNIIVNIFSKT